MAGLNYFSGLPIAGRLERREKKLISSACLSMPWRYVSLLCIFISKVNTRYHAIGLLPPNNPGWVSCISFLQSFYKEINSVADAFCNSFCKNVNKFKSLYCGGERRDEVPAGATGSVNKLENNFLVH